MANRFILNETSYHGAGAIESIATEAVGRGFKKAFVCSDPDLIKFGVTKKVLDVLDKANLAYEVYSDIKAAVCLSASCKQQLFKQLVNYNIYPKKMQVISLNIFLFTNLLYQFLIITCAGKHIQNIFCRFIRFHAVKSLAHNIYCFLLVCVQ